MLATVDVKDVPGSARSLLPSPLQQAPGWRVAHRMYATFNVKDVPGSERSLWPSPLTCAARSQVQGLGERCPPALYFARHVGERRHGRVVLE